MTTTKPAVRLIAVLAAVSCLTAITPAQAQILSVNFTGRANGPGDVTDNLLKETGSSEPLVAGLNGNSEWVDVNVGTTNSINETGIGLGGVEVDLVGTAVGRWSATASGGRIVADEDPNGDVFDGFLEANNNTGINLTISGLLDDFTTGYDVYLYTGGFTGQGNTLSGSFSVNGGVPVDYEFTGAYNPTDVNDPTTGGLVQGEHLLVFEGIFTDELTILGGGNTQGTRSGLWGLEIIPTSIRQPVLGDVDGDEDVDNDDFLIIRDNFRATGAPREMGDLTGDGTVDFSDFLQWQNNFPTAAPSTATLSAVGVPEPASVLVLLPALGLFGSVRRRRSNR